MQKVAPDKRASAADFLRVFSIFIISWYHIWQQSWLNPNIHINNTTIDIYPVVTHGYMFVDIMLLISGFLLMLGYLDGRYNSLKKYYLSRFFRIVPSYLFCIAVMLFCFALPNHKYGSTEYLLKDLVSHLTFTHNLLREGYNCSQLNVVLWTLAVEMQFYLIFPFIAKCFRRMPVLTYIALLAVNAGSKYWVSQVPTDTSLYINRLPAMLDVYANGMIAAYIYSKLRDRHHAPILKALYLIALPLVCCGVYFIMQKQSYIGDPALERLGQMYYRFPLTFLGSVFLVCGSLTFNCVQKLFSNPVTRFLGALSYNYYIWHQTLAVWLKSWHIPDYTSEYPNSASEQPWQTQYTFVCFGAALLAAFLVTYLIEKPCSHLGNRLIAKVK